MKAAIETFLEDTFRLGRQFEQEQRGGHIQPCADKQFLLPEWWRKDVDNVYFHVERTRANTRDVLAFYSRQVDHVKCRWLIGGISTPVPSAGPCISPTTSPSSSPSVTTSESVGSVPSVEPTMCPSSSATSVPTPLPTMNHQGKLMAMEREAISPDNESAAKRCREG